MGCVWRPWGLQALDPCLHGVPHPCWPGAPGLCSLRPHPAFLGLFKKGWMRVVRAPGRALPDRNQNCSLTQAGRRPGSWDRDCLLLLFPCSLTMTQAWKQRAGPDVPGSPPPSQGQDMLPGLAVGLQLQPHPRFLDDLGKGPHFSEPQIPHLQNGHNAGTWGLGCSVELMKSSRQGLTSGLQEACSKHLSFLSHAP